MRAALHAVSEPGRVRRASSREDGDAGWGATAQVGVRGVSAWGGGAAWSRVSEPKWGAEDTHAGRWAGEELKGDEEREKPRKGN